MLSAGASPRPTNTKGVVHTDTCASLWGESKIEAVTLIFNFQLEKLVLFSFGGKNE